MAVDIETIGLAVDTSGVVKGTKDLDNFDRQANKSSKSADGLSDSIGGMVKSFIGISAAYAGFQKLANVLDEYTKYTVILKNATAGQNEFNAAMADIRRIANTAQTDVAGLATTYARFSNALKDFGATQSQVSTLTETVALALKANGASAMETSSAMLQLSQAFGAGRLSGDEFRSMAEAAPNLMRALAASIGVSVGALKDMGAEGKLTSDVLLKAFTDPALLSGLQSQAREVKTLSGAWQVLKNEVAGVVTSIGDSTGIVDIIAKSVGALTLAVRELNDVLKTGKVQFDTWLPAYGKFREAMDKQASVMWSPAATVNGAIDGFSGLKTNNRSLSIMTDAEIEAADKAEKERLKLAKKAAEDAANYERELALSVSAWKEKQANDYQDKLRKQVEDAAKAERDLVMQESAWKAKQEDDYQKKLLKDWQAREKEKADIIKKNADDAEKAALKQAQDLQKEYDRISDTLSRSLTDALYRGFESGKSFLQNFVDTLKNTFKTLILQPIIKLIVDKSGITGLIASITGAISGTANAETGESGISGILSSGMDIVKGITKGFDTLNTGFQSSIESLGALIANGNGGIRDAIGGALGKYSQGISKALGYAGAAYAGFNYLKNGNYAGAALTAAGAYFGGPVGAALGSAIGGLFGKKKSTPRYSSGVSTTYADGQFSSTNLYGLAGFKKDAGGREGLSAAGETFSKTLSGLLGAFGINSTIGTNLQFFKRKGAWGFGSATVDGISTGTIGGDSVYSKDAQEAFNNLINEFLTTGLTNAIKVSKLPDGIKALFDNITDKSVMQNMINATASLANAQDALSNRFNLTADTAGKVAIATGLAGDELAKFVSALASTALSTQKTSVSLLKQRDALTSSIGSLPSSIAAFDSILKGIDATTLDGQKKFADLFGLRDQFANFTNAWDSVVSNVESSIYGLLSPSEQLAIDNANLAKMFAGLNISVPNSLQDLINLGKSIDYTTESGLDLALAFPTLVKAFEATKEGVNSLSQSLSSSYFTTRADFLSAQISASNGGGVQQFVKSQAQINADLVEQMKQMKQTNMDLKAYLTTLSENAAKQQRTLEDWDVNGMPAVRAE